MFFSDFSRECFDQKYLNNPTPFVFFLSKTLFGKAT